MGRLAPQGARGTAEYLEREDHRLSMQLRNFTLEDYEAVIDLWHNTDIHIGPSESREGLAHKLERDADLFLVADDNGQIIGAVEGAYDGRRGWVYHLAVSPPYQKQGIGRQLLTELETRLKARGCLKLNLLIYADNADVQQFYQRLDFQRDNIIFMGKRLR